MHSSSMVNAPTALRSLSRAGRRAATLCLLIIREAPTSHTYYFAALSTPLELTTPSTGQHFCEMRHVSCVSWTKEAIGQIAVAYNISAVHCAVSYLPVYKQIQPSPPRRIKIFLCCRHFWLLTPSSSALIAFSVPHYLTINVPLFSLRGS
jgi:hypothetical protein